MASLLTIISLSLLFYIYPAFSQNASSPCKSLTFTSKNKTFSNCNDLPSLGASLHWTYDQSHSSLSMAFTAEPPTANGWVLWALNPKGTGMLGAQALLAIKPSSKASITVNTIDINSYHSVLPSPISYNVTEISAEENDGKITIFATWAIPKGESTVNTVWHAGHSYGGKPNMHAFERHDLNDKMTLDLSGKGGSTNETARAPPGPAKGLGVSLLPMQGFGLALIALVASLL